jgi:hypothetical protein
MFFICYSVLVFSLCVLKSHQDAPSVLISVFVHVHVSALYVNMGTVSKVFCQGIDIVFLLCLFFFNLFLFSLVCHCFIFSVFKTNFLYVMILSFPHLLPSSLFS